MIDLPAGEERATHVPALALTIRRQDERTLPSTDQHSHPGHTDSRRLEPLRCSRVAILARFSPCPRSITTPPVAPSQHVGPDSSRSEEHTSELQSPMYL